MFAEQDELMKYTNHVIDKYKLRKKIELNANVVSVKWDSHSNSWDIETEQNGTFNSQFLINASGPLSTPVIPNFPGKDSFKGKSFHTNHWNHTYNYKGKRVAIIGSGASAAQVIPAIAPHVKHLHVFQRTPHWVLPRPDKTFSKIERQLLGFKGVNKLLRTYVYWSLETRVIGFKYSSYLLNQFAQKEALKHLKNQIPDVEMRQKLTPEFTIGCKRIILSNTLYPALAQENCSLYSKEQGIKAITGTGITTQDNQQIDVDLIVYSTGYDATDGMISYPVIGKNGYSLNSFWQQYPRAYLGTTTPNFPNLFVVTGPNTGIGHTSAIFVIEAQMNYIMKSIKSVLTKKCNSIEVTANAEADYTHMIHSEMEKTVWKAGGCHSWYQSKSGHVTAMFPGFSFTYRHMANEFKPEHHIYS